MKIYFTCSTAEFTKYRDIYFSIRSYLIDHGHLLTRDWLPHTDELIRHGNTNIRDIKQIYQQCLDAIRNAELVIIEDTVSNFSTGHQITLAQQMRKPTLVLWQGRKHRQFKQMFIHGIDSDILEIAEYESKNIDQIIHNFIVKYGNSDIKSRFHLVLNQPERQYLDWAELNTGKSRTSIIRQALHQLVKNDIRYSEYINHKD